MEHQQRGDASLTIGGGGGSRITADVDHHHRCSRTWSSSASSSALSHSRLGSSGASISKRIDPEKNAAVTRKPTDDDGDDEEDQGDKEGDKDSEDEIPIAFLWAHLTSQGEIPEEFQRYAEVFRGGKEHFQLQDNEDESDLLLRRLAAFTPGSETLAATENARSTVTPGGAKLVAEVVTAAVEAPPPPHGRRHSTCSKLSDVASTTTTERLLRPFSISQEYQLDRSRAIWAQSIKNYRSAVIFFNRALELRPADKYCLVARAKCYLHLGSSSEALQDAETSLKDDGQFPRGLFMKAEALYQMGKFEMALVYYHRGYNSRPEMHEFKVGIQKAEEAINNSIGPKSDLVFFPGQLEEFLLSPKQRQHAVPLATANSKLAAGNCGKLKRIEGIDLMDPDEDKSKRMIRRPAGQVSHHHRSGSENKGGQLTGAEEKAAKVLLGQLYNDREFLGKLLKEEETRPVKHAKSQKSKVRDLCTDGISYLDNRTEFWRQQKPVSQRAAGRHGASGRTTAATRDMYFSKVGDIEASFLRGDVDAALSATRRLQSQVSKEPDVTFPHKPEIIAYTHHFLGNCLLEKGDLTGAMVCFVKEKELGDNCNLPEARSRALDDMGRTAAKQGDFNKAIDIWQQKLNGQTCSLIEQTWLQHEIGRAYYEIGNLPAALDCAKQALSAAKAEGNRPWVLNCDVLLAQTQTRLGNYEPALEFFDDAHHVSEEVNDEESRRAIKIAVEQLTDRLRSGGGGGGGNAAIKSGGNNEDEEPIAYRATIAFSGLKQQVQALAILFGSGDRSTRQVQLGTFSETITERTVELRVSRQGDSLERANIWMDVNEPSFDVAKLEIEDALTKRMIIFETSGWSTNDDGATVRQLTARS